MDPKTDVIISLTRSEWKQCLEAMKILLKHSQTNNRNNSKSKSKNNKTEQQAQSMIENLNKINESIFLKHGQLNQKSQQQAEKKQETDILNSMNNMTDKEFDAILNQIKKESSQPNVCLTCYNLQPQNETNKCIFFSFTYVLLCVLFCRLVVVMIMV